MAASFSRSRVAGVALAVLLSLSACGGGGGGDTEPPPPPVDTTLPGPKSWLPIDGATDIDADGIVTVSVTMNEAITCPGTNPFTITRGNGQEVEGGDWKCESPTVSLSFQSKALFRCETYTVKLAGGIKDLAGNQSVEASISFSTKCPPPRTAMIVTANAGTSADPRYTSVVNTETSEVSHYGPASYRPLETKGVAVDSENHRAYYTATISASGCAYSMDLETRAVECIKVNPEGSSDGRSAAVTVADQGVYFATSSEFSDQPGNLVLAFDRLNRTKFATVTLPDAAYSPVFMVADRERNRVYVLSYNKASLVFNPWPDYLPGFAGKVYEIDTTTNALARTFSVGSGPSGAVIDPVKRLLYVSNWGDRTISIINLGTGVVRKVDLPSFFAEDDKYRQRPVGLALAGTKLLIANSKFSKDSPTDQVGGLAVLDLASETITQTIPVGDIPYHMASVGNDVWVTTGNTASKQYFVVRVSVVTLAALESVAVGPSPYGIAVYAP